VRYIHKISAIYAQAALAPKIEVDPDLKISVEDVYKLDPEYKKFVMTVGQHLMRYSGKFNLKNSELLKMFLNDLKNELR